MKKILIQIDSDKVPSSFESITALDTGVDHLLTYSGIIPGEVSDIVYGAIYSKEEEELKNNAIYIGGSNVPLGEILLKEALECFFENTRVSIMMDANGCNTTAAAAVRKILSCGNIKGKNVTVLGGTGPVGIRAAGLLGKEGALVTITSRNPDKANDACEVIGKRFGVEVTPVCVNEIDETEEVIGDSFAILAAGTVGVTMLPESIWKNNHNIKVMADVNAIPPLGIEGTKSHWSAKEKEGKLIFGAIGIESLKMKVHRECISLLFEQNDMVLDAEGIYNAASRLN